MITRMLDAPVLELSLIGGLANRMIEYMFAASLKRMVPSLLISNVEIPEFEISFPKIAGPEEEKNLLETMRIGVADLAAEILSNPPRTYKYSWYAQHMDNFDEDEKFLSTLFRERDEKGFANDELVINIRGGEILDGRHPGYVLIPISFYKFLVETTGLNPVFFGQIEDNAYIAELRSAFPSAKYVASVSALADFDILRKSHHLVPAVSTFSWLAALTSDAKVHLPAIGLFNPFQEKDHLLIPKNKARYSIYLFPILHSVPVDSFRPSHEMMDGRWETTTSSLIQKRLKSFPYFKCDKEEYMDVLDISFYLENYEDVRLAFDGDRDKATTHYNDNGYDEGRFGFAFDEKKYIAKHVDAAAAVGRGEFSSAREHYIMVGRHFGYQAC